MGKEATYVLKEPISTYQCRFVDVSKCLVVNINTIEEGGGGGAWCHNLHARVILHMILKVMRKEK